MSSAHYFFRNYDIKQVINLLCYMTEYPHTLTSTQKITRLYRYAMEEYRCLLRREKEWTMGENRCDPKDYHRNIRLARRKLEPLMSVSESSAVFGETLEHFEKRIRKNLDPTMLINDARQYSASNGRQYVWSDKELLNDPFGYYTGRMIGHRQPGYGFLYYPDFPYDSTVWHMDPPAEFDDQVQEQSFRK